MDSFSDFSWENMLGAEDVSVDDELKGTAEIYISKRTAKTDEEINKLCTANGLSEIDRVTEILRRGSPIQKSSIVKTFEWLATFHELAPGLLSTIIPMTLDMMHLESIPFQVQVSAAIQKLLPLMNPSQTNAIYSKAKILSAHKLEAISSLWKEIYLSTIPKLSEQEIMQQIVRGAINEAALPQPAHLRIWCGRILGKAACFIDYKKFETSIYPKLSQLCQDTDHDVRKVMATQISAVIRRFGVRKCLKTAFTDFLDLLSDEETSVQITAIRAMIDNIDAFDGESKNNFLIPIWKKLTISTNSEVVGAVLDYFGHFIFAVKNEMNEPERQYLLAFYYQNCTKSSDIVNTRRCAFCFSGILASLSPTSYSLYKLDKAIRSLGSEEDVQTQQTIAAQLCILASSFGQSSNRILIPILNNYLKSEDEKLINMLLRNIKAIIIAFSPFQEENDGLEKEIILLFDSILAASLEFKEKPYREWRLQEQVIQAFAVFPSFFEHELIFEKVVPHLFSIIEKPNIQKVKIAAITSVVSIMRTLKKNEHHEAILRFLVEMKDEKDYHIRILYFNVCEQVMLQFSKKFFRMFFFYGYLGLSRDLIPNIRVRFISILPLVRHCLRLPVDNHLLAKLIDSTESLAFRDKDSGVMLSMKNFHTEHGLLHQPSCCHVLPSESEIGQPVEEPPIKRVLSFQSITDRYLITDLKWTELDSDEKDQQKEDFEQKFSFFVLDPVKRVPNAVSKQSTIKKQESLKKLPERAGASIRSITSASALKQKHSLTTSSSPSIPKRGLANDPTPIISNNRRISLSVDPSSTTPRTSSNTPSPMATKLALTPISESKKIDSTGGLASRNK